MRYAQFYTESTGYVPGSIPPRFDPAYKTLIEGCGDRAVIIIDARIRAETAGHIAAQECKARGFQAWRIFEGESFTRSRPVSGLWRVTGAEDKEIARAMNAHVKGA